MGIVIDDDLMHAARMSEPEIKLELAALLYQRDRLTLGHAAHRPGGGGAVRFVARGVWRNPHP